MRLFVFDVDGTLVVRGTNKIDSLDLHSIHHLLENGDAVCVASGRPFCSVQNVLSQFGDGNKYIICANGAASYQLDGTVINENTLTLDTLYSFYNKYKDKGFIVYGYDTNSGLILFEESICTDLEVQLCDVKKENFVFMPKEGKPEGLEIPLLKVVLAAPAEVAAQVDITSEDFKPYTANRSDACFIEILKKGSDKEFQVENLRKHLDIKKEDVYCFGDAGNDFTMIRDNYGIAMGNGFEEIKKVAKYVTTDVKYQGVTHALKHLGFVD